MGRNTQKAQKNLSGKQKDKAQGAQNSQGPQGSQSSQSSQKEAKIQNFQSLIDAYGIDAAAAEDGNKLYELLQYINDTLFRGRGVIQIYDGPGGSDPLNAGSSGVVLASFGHFIIHLFSQRRVATVDYLADLSSENLRKTNCAVIMKAVKKYFGADRYDQCQGRAGQSFGNSISFHADYMPLSRMVIVADRILPRVGTKQPSSKNTVTVDGSNYDLIYTIPHGHIVFHASVHRKCTVASVFSRNPIKWDLWQDSLQTYGLVPQGIAMIGRGADVEE